MDHRVEWLTVEKHKFYLSVLYICEDLFMLLTESVLLLLSILC